jgi:hypothetical protein
MQVSHLIPTSDAKQQSNNSRQQWAAAINMLLFSNMLKQNIADSTPRRQCIHSSHQLQAKATHS